MGLTATGRKVLAFCSACFFAQDVCCKVKWGRLWLPPRVRWWVIVPQGRRWPCPWWHCSASGFGKLTGEVSYFHYNLLVFKVFFGLHGVAASSLIRLHDRVLISVVTPFFKGSYVILPKLFDISLRVSLFVHAHSILLILSTIVPQLYLCAESKDSLAHLSFCDSADFP